MLQIILILVCFVRHHVKHAQVDPLVAVLLAKLGTICLELHALLHVLIYITKMFFNALIALNPA